MHISTDSGYSVDIEGPSSVIVRQRNAIERRAEAMLSENADYGRLKTIPGIGPINALTALAEAGDLHRFAINANS